MEKINTNNYWKGRGGFDIEAIVLHITEGSYASVKSWFENDNSYVSSHDVVKTNGDIINCVDEKDSAWSCGVVLNPTWQGLKYKGLGGFDLDKLKEYEGRNIGEQGEIFQGQLLGGSGTEIINPNLYTYNIEVISFGGVPPFAQWKAVANRVKEKAEKHNIKTNNIGLVHHNEIRSNKACPGKYITRNWINLINKFF